MSSNVKLNELESMQAYYREPKAKKLFIRCAGCSDVFRGYGYEEGDKCDDCIEVETNLRKRQAELDQ